MPLVHTPLIGIIDGREALEFLVEGPAPPHPEPVSHPTVVAGSTQVKDISDAHSTASTGPRAAAFTEAHEVDLTVVLETAPAAELCGAAHEPLAVVCSLHYRVVQQYTSRIQNFNLGRM